MDTLENNPDHEEEQPTSWDLLDDRTDPFYTAYENLIKRNIVLPFSLPEHDRTKIDTAFEFFCEMRSESVIDNAVLTLGRSCLPNIYSAILSKYELILCVDEFSKRLRAYASHRWEQPESKQGWMRLRIAAGEATYRGFMCALAIRAENVVAWLYPHVSNFKHSKKSNFILYQLYKRMRIAQKSIKKPTVKETETEIETLSSQPPSSSFLDKYITPEKSRQIWAEVLRKKPMPAKIKVELQDLSETQRGILRDVCGELKRIIEIEKQTLLRIKLKREASQSQRDVEATADLSRKHQSEGQSSSANEYNVAGSKPTEPNATTGQSGQPQQPRVGQGEEKRGVILLDASIPMITETMGAKQRIDKDRDSFDIRASFDETKRQWTVYWKGVFDDNKEITVDRRNDSLRVFFNALKKAASCPDPKRYELPTLVLLSLYDDEKEKFGVMKSSLREDMSDFENTSAPENRISSGEAKRKVLKLLEKSVRDRARKSITRAKKLLTNHCHAGSDAKKIIKASIFQQGQKLWTSIDPYDVLVDTPKNRSNFLVPYW